MPTLTQTSDFKECVVNLHISRRGKGGYAIHTSVNWVICWEYHLKWNINLSEGTPKRLVLHAVRGPQFLPGHLNSILLCSPSSSSHLLHAKHYTSLSQLIWLPSQPYYVFLLSRAENLTHLHIPTFLHQFWHIKCSKDSWSSDSEWIRRYQFSFFDSVSSGHLVET